MENFTQTEAPSHEAPPPRQANITAVLGASQTGKGVYCKERLREPHTGVTMIWSPLDKTNDFAGYIGGRRYTELWTMADALDAGERLAVYVPNVDDREKLAVQFSYFCKIVAELPNVRLVVDELSLVTLPSYAPPAWSALSTAGAHAGLELIGTAQRAAMIDKAFLANCTEIRCFRLVYPMDARHVAPLLRVPELDLMNLPDLHYRHRNLRRPDLETELGVQALP